jgi:hypothetical protein
MDDLSNRAQTSCKSSAAAIVWMSVRAHPAVTQTQPAGQIFGSTAKLPGKHSADPTLGNVSSGLWLGQLGFNTWLQHTLFQRPLDFPAN